MRRMNCKRACEMLPLYTAGDLEGSREREVAAHLAACVACRRLAAEFSESSHLLAEACATPEFGAEFYAGIRSAVLSEIRRDRPTPSTPSLFIASLFTRRLAYAASFAVALIVLALALQHARRAAQPAPTQIAQGQHPATDVTPERRTFPTMQSRTFTPAPSSDAVAKESSSHSTTIPATPTRRAMRRGATALRDEENPTNDAQTALTLVAAVPHANVNPAREASAPSAVGSANAASQPAPEVSRIEIQTADPNIRIIWLAPQKSEEPNPNPNNRENRDNQENGDRK
jgi:anti-sigma factor RsiW